MVTDNQESSSPIMGEGSTFYNSQPTAVGEQSVVKNSETKIHQTEIRVDEVLDTQTASSSILDALEKEGTAVDPVEPSKEDIEWHAVSSRQEKMGAELAEQGLSSPAASIDKIDSSVINDEKPYPLGFVAEECNIPKRKLQRWCENKKLPCEILVSKVTGKKIYSVRLCDVRVLMAQELAGNSSLPSAVDVKASCDGIDPKSEVMGHPLLQAEARSGTNGPEGVTSMSASLPVGPVAKQIGFGEAASGSKSKDSGHSGYVIHRIKNSMRKLDALDLIKIEKWLVNRLEVGIQKTGVGARKNENHSS